MRKKGEVRETGQYSGKNQAQSTPVVWLVSGWVPFNGVDKEDNGFMQLSENIDIRYTP